jgi:hypothetical protein
MKPFKVQARIDPPALACYSTGMKHFLIFTLGLFTTAVLALPSHSSPTVQYNGRRVVGVPSKQHNPTGQSIELLETEDCDAKAVSNSSIEVSENCKYLHGIYRYIYVPGGEKIRHQVLMDFSLSKSGGKNHSFLVNEPMEIDETSISGLPN